MKLAHPVTIGGVTYSVISPRLRGSPKEWAAYDKSADTLQRLVQTASILCDVPQDVLLELDSDDFTPLMHEVGQMAAKFARQQKQ